MPTTGQEVPLRYRCTFSGSFGAGGAGPTTSDDDQGKHPPTAMTALTVGARQMRARGSRGGPMAATTQGHAVGRPASFQRGVGQDAEGGGHSEGGLSMAVKDGRCQRPGGDDILFYFCFYFISLSCRLLSHIDRKPSRQTRSHGW